MKRIFSLRDSVGWDLVLYAAALTLALTGLVVMYGASSVSAWHQLGDSDYYIRRQFLLFLLGLVALFVMATIPLVWLQRNATWIALALLFLLLLVFVPGIGRGVRGNQESFQRWLAFGPVSFQPSEFAKVAIVLYMARILSLPEILRTEYDVRKLTPAILLVGSMLAAIILEPQYGTTISIGAVIAVMIFLSGFPMIRLLAIGLAALPVLYLLIVLWTYRLERFKVWLDPFAYRNSGGYQLVTSYRAFQDGGLTGVELAQGFAVRYLPYGHTDFILPLTAENFGFVMVVFILFLFMFFMWRAFRNIKQLEDPFAFMVAAGSLIMLIMQTLVNLSVVTGLAPTTGISLPFFSYGGSSLVASLMFCGLLLNTTKRAG